MTELGVYILGATALAILAAAGINAGNGTVILAATVSSGAAYLSQLGAAYATMRPSGVATTINGVFMLVALGAWAFGVFNLL